MASTLARLAGWYARQCDGEWEHFEGVRIDTLDNPGWSITISLVGTPLENRTFNAVEDAYKDDVNWLRCWKDGAEFHGVCGPSRLDDVLVVFLEWAGV